MKFYADRSLTEIFQTGHKFTEYEQCVALFTLAAGLFHLHKQGVIHADIALR